MPTHSKAAALVLDAPEFFQDPGFLAWLASDHGHSTNYRAGRPVAGAEVLVLVDPGLAGEGSASDMPDWCWAVVLDTCRAAYAPQSGANHILVHLRNRGA